jgi:excisionase family DNA binding protein
MLERRAALRALVTSLPTTEALVPASVIQVEPVVAVQPARANRTSSSAAIRVELEVAPVRENAAEAPTRATNSEPVRITYPDVLTLSEAAGYLRFGVSTVRAWVKQGHIPHVMIGRAVRFRREALERWLASMEKSGEMPS